MFRNLVTSFLQHEKITTTDSKAKELRPIAEKMITLGKRGDLHARRLASAYIRDSKVVAKLFDTIAPRFKERPGGYTRIVKLGIRPGDNAPLSIIQLVEEELAKKEVKKPAKKAAPKTAKAAPKAKLAEEVKAEEAPAAEEVVKSAVKDPADECEASAD